MPRPDRTHLAPVRDQPARPDPPTAIEAEMCVLGVLMLSGRMLPEVTSRISADDFYRPDHRTIYTTLEGMAAEGRPLDEALVVAELQRGGTLTNMGGPLFVHSLVEAPETTRHAAHYATQVAEAASLRHRADLGLRIAALEATTDPGQVAHLAAELAALATGQPRGWEAPIPLAASSSLPAFPVDVLPGWLGEYVAAVAVATQTPPDLGGLHSLAILAAVAAGAVEINPRGDWVEPLCLYTAVGMEPGSRKSAVVNALTGPLAAFEDQQAEQAKDAIAEAAVKKRLAEQAAARAEQAAAKATSAKEAKQLEAEAVARAQEAARLTVPPAPRWLVDDATPEALATLVATHGRIALLSAEGDVFDQMAGRYQQNPNAGPNLGVYLKGHAGDRSGVDRKGRDAERIPRTVMTIGVTPQPDVLQSLAARPGFKGRGLLARFLYSLPASLIGHRQTGRRVPPVPAAVADRYTLELQAMAASLAAITDPPALLRLDQDAGEVLDDFEAALEPRQAPATGDLAHLSGWASKLAGATCRIAGLLHLATHLHHGWDRPVDARTMLDAVKLAGYLTEHALATFDLMGMDPRLQDARWLLDWINRTGATQFSRREVHMTARSRFRKAADLDPPLALLEEHGWIRRADPETSRDPRGRGRPPSPRYLVNPLSPDTESTETTKTRPDTNSVVSVDSVSGSHHQSTPDREPQ